MTFDAATLQDILIEQAQDVYRALGRPRVVQAHLGDPNPDRTRDAEFGMLTLERGGSGLYYAWLGGEQADLPRHYRAADLVGQDALELARRYRGESDIDRSIGLAAINALTDRLYLCAGFEPEPAGDSMGGLTLAAGDHLGMIGNFAPLVRRARALGVQVSVLERKAHMVHKEAGLEISLDPTVLEHCNKVICTGATLLNATLPAVLEYCTGAEITALVGPTVGFFPDALFDLGIDILAGTRINDSSEACACLARGAGLGSAGTKTLIHRAGYPGFDSLLARAKAAFEPC